MVLVSVIIPTYNRYNYLLNAINSVKAQTHKDIEIIVINDGSLQPEYYNFNDESVIMIHLKQNSRHVFGYPCAGHVRNEGIRIAKGKYIAFCDDDDIWFPNKLQLQLDAMETTKCKMSCTDTLLGNGTYDINITYERSLGERYKERFKTVYQQEGNDELKDGYPKVWNLRLIQIRNLCICSSVVVDRELLNSIGNMKTCHIREYEDYDCWKRLMEHTDCAFVETAEVYYDVNHGDGKLY
jgi:glycosyltransferase involved in cell wall biosynthesis